MKLLIHVVFSIILLEAHGVKETSHCRSFGDLEKLKNIIGAKKNTEKLPLFQKLPPKVKNENIAHIDILSKGSKISQGKNIPTLLSFSKYTEEYRIIGKRLASLAAAIGKRPHVHRFHRKLMKNGSFTDLDANEYEDLREHARRLGALTYREISQNSTLSERTKSSFSLLTYQTTNIRDSNWWSHLIGIPTVMWPAIFMARSDLNKTLISDFLTRYFRKTAQGPVWNPQEMSGRMAGGNLGPRMFFGLVENYLCENLHEFHEQLMKVFYNEVIRRDSWNGNGMRADGCLHQHNQIIHRKSRNGTFSKIILSQVYNNNYGKEFLKHAAIVMWVLDGTQFDLGDVIEEGIYDSFFECQQWLYRHTTVEPSTVGRFINSGNRVTYVGGLDAVARTLKYFLKTKRHQRKVVAALQRYYHQPPPLNFALIGNKHFFVSDLMVHQRAAYMASLRLLSRRTCRPETVPSYTKANMGTGKGYFLGDGFLSVLVTGKEFGTPNKELFQAYDWARIPGTTCHYTSRVPEISTFSPNKKHSYNDADIVGGVTNRDVGVAVLDYNRPTVAVKGKKSWFFFDDVILCMGSGINIPKKAVDKNPVTTTINQVVYEGHHTVGDSTRQKHSRKKSIRAKRWVVYGMRDQIWFHHNFIGYIPLLHNGRVVLELDKRAILPSNKPTHLNSFSLWLDHGPHPTNSTYAYALLPGQSTERTRSFALNPPISILMLDNYAHAACYESDKILGVVFFEQKCLRTDCLIKHSMMICSDEPILLIFKAFPAQISKEKYCSGRMVSTVAKMAERMLIKLLWTIFPNIAFIRSKPHYLVQNDERFFHDNEIWRNSVIQISVADPTQKLTRVNLKVKERENIYEVPIDLPKPPRQGESVTLCLELPL